jgi:type I site-specific restriction-modification system R (restriction) subunit
MTKVLFGEYSFRIEERDRGKYIFDIARKKFVTLTPEEWVRQHVLHYLVYTKSYPLNHIAIERGIELNGLKKRFDIAVFSSNAKPVMIIECKAPEELLNEKVFEQAARYNLSLKVNYLWVTNGLANYCCSLINGIKLLDEIPEYSMLTATE